MGLVEMLQASANAADSPQNIEIFAMGLTKFVCFLNAVLAHDMNFMNDLATALLQTWQDADGKAPPLFRLAAVVETVFASIPRRIRPLNFPGRDHTRKVGWGVHVVYGRSLIGQLLTIAAGQGTLKPLNSPHTPPFFLSHSSSLKSWSCRGMA